MTITDAKQKLIAWLNAQIGYPEGANNWNKYAADERLKKLLGWNAQNQPWCDLFTDEAFIECFGLELAAAMTYQPIGRGSALCRQSAQYFKDNGAWCGQPETGDVVFFYVSGAINHQGIVVAVGMGAITVVEGNSSDKVSRVTYAIGAANIAGYGRPNWELVASEDERAETSVGAEGTPAPPATADEPTGAADEFQIPAANYHSYRYSVKLNLLKLGDAGSLVHTLQLLLNGKGFPCNVTGRFNNSTRDALIAFQSAAGLLADGECGGQSWAALHSYRV